MVNFKKAKGFTLIELLVVISIIAILSVFVVINLISGQTKARDAQRKKDLTMLASALDRYYSDNKNYPVTPLPSGFYDVSSSSITPAFSTLVTNGYLSDIPSDPNGKSSYQYESDAKQYKVIATSPETMAGLTGDCTDQTIKNKAGDFCDPATNEHTRFQISSSNTAANW